MVLHNYIGPEAKLGCLCIKVSTLGIPGHRAAWILADDAGIRFYSRQHSAVKSSHDCGQPDGRAPEVLDVMHLFTSTTRCLGLQLEDALKCPLKCLLPCMWPL